MKKDNFFANIIFWITLISPMAAFALASLIGESSIFGVAGIIRYSWIMWLFIPLGILSILIGIKLKKNRQKYRKNFMVAFICLPIILILGSYRFIFSNVLYDTDKIIAVETETKLNLPDEIKIATNMLDAYDVSYLKILNSESKIEFEHELETNPLWQNVLSSKIKSLLPVDIQYEVEAFDYFVFYNITSDEYNAYPTDGEYECLFIAYDYDLQRMIIVDNYRVVLN